MRCFSYFTIMVCFICITMVSTFGKEGAPSASSTPPAALAKKTAKAYFEAMQAKGIASAATFMHSEALANFKKLLLPVFESEVKAGTRTMMNQMFGTEATIEDVKKTAHQDFMHKFMTGVSKQMVDAKPRFEKIEILGSVPEGNKLHILARITVGARELSMTQMEVISLKPEGAEWKILLTGKMEGMAKMLNARAKQ